MVSPAVKQMAHVLRDPGSSLFLGSLLSWPDWSPHGHQVAGMAPPVPTQEGSAWPRPPLRDAVFGGRTRGLQGAALSASGGDQRRVPALADHGGGGLDFHGCSGQSGLSLNSGGGASIPGVGDIFVEYFGKKEMGREQLLGKHGTFQAQAELGLCARTLLLEGVRLPVSHMP